MPTTRQKTTTHRAIAAQTAQRSLVQAFTTFTHAAGSLENSYAQLHNEIVRLRRELEQRNNQLAESFQENQRIRNYLENILEGLPCGVLVVASDGRLRVINPEAGRLLGVESDFTIESARELPELLQRILSEVTLEGSAAERTWSVGHGDESRHLAVTRARLAQEDAPGGDSIFILRDITEQKRLEKEHESARRMQALAEMAMVLAHEIRNPLGSLELFAGLLADATQGNGDARQWVDHLQAGLRSVSATVNNVLQFHSQPPPELLPVNVVRLLRETVDFLKPLARQRGIRIDFVNFLGDVSVPGDPHRLQQVFLNLAINAFRAMSPHGCLKVVASWSDPMRRERVQIEFEDKGSGISSENLEKIFSPGFSTSPDSPGLGLAVCRKIVAQHDGTIQVKSVPHEGTTFRLEFPIQGATE